MWVLRGAMLFKVLRDEGRDDLIYAMTSKTTYPSWGLMRESGATTIWEMWEKDLPGHSLLHSSYLYPGAWYIDGLLGIRMNEPGFRQFDIRIPCTADTSLQWVKGSYDSPAGLIESRWQIEKDKRIVEVTVPPNCQATIYFPVKEDDVVTEPSGYANLKGHHNGCAVFEVPAGRYQFSN